MTDSLFISFRDLKYGMAELVIVVVVLKFEEPNGSLEIDGNAGAGRDGMLLMPPTSRNGPNSFGSKKAKMAAMNWATARATQAGDPLSME